MRPIEGVEAEGRQDVTDAGEDDVHRDDGEQRREERRQEQEHHAGAAPLEPQPREGERRTRADEDRAERPDRAR